MSKTRIVGTSSIRVDGHAKVSGAAQYVDDLDFGPGLLHAAVVESTHAHARLKKVDVSAAAKAPGVVRVVTGKDFPYMFGLYMQDRYIFAQDRVRFVGEQIAAVIADTPEAALRAAKLVKVDYAPLPAVLSLDDALKKDAVILHPDLGSYQKVPWFFPRPGTNIAHWRKTRKGSVAKGFKQADFILEDTYTVPRYAHCPIETHAVTGLFDLSGRLTLWASSQSPFAQRNVMATALKPFGLSHRDIRIVTPYVGGGFGGKAGVSMEIIAAVLAIAMKGRPVKLNWTREQEFMNTSQRQGVIARVKMGVKKNGRIVALEHTLHWDAGASAEYGANVVNAVGFVGDRALPCAQREDRLGLRLHQHASVRSLPRLRLFRVPLRPRVAHHPRRESHRHGPGQVPQANAIMAGDTLAYGARYESRQPARRDRPRCQGNPLGQGAEAQGSE